MNSFANTMCSRMLADMQNGIQQFQDTVLVTAVGHKVGVEQILVEVTVLDLLF